MVSGLRAATFEGKLEERRHQTDMLQMLKIQQGYDKVSPMIQSVVAGAKGDTTCGRLFEREGTVPGTLCQTRPEEAFLRGRSSSILEPGTVPAKIKKCELQDSFKWQYR